MPLSVRARIAMVYAAMVVATLVLFGIVLRAVQTSQHAREQEDEVRALTVELARRLGEELVFGEPLLIDTTRSCAPRPDDQTCSPEPAATDRLRDLVSGIPNYVYVFAGSGRIVYDSYDVRGLASAQRRILDSVALNVPGGENVGLDPSRRLVVSDPLVARGVTHVPLRNGEMLVHAVTLDVTPLGINRVAVGRVLDGTRFSFAEFLGPIIILAPLVLLAAVGAAHVSTRLAYAPVEQIINDVREVSDGRSLHRRVAVEERADEHLMRLTDTLNAMIARLETSFAALRRFTADASHELKTPLTVLRADVERAMATTVDSNERLVALEEALAETTRMAGLVDSLLTLARADEGRFELDREPVDLRALAQDVYETAVLLGESRKVNVKMRPPTPTLVRGDRGRLRQLLLNLVENAIKYTPTAGTVEIALVHVGAQAEFSVSDSGIGIAAADLPHIFDRFWRADRARSRGSERPGFGLGLAISQYIAQAHGGSLTATSRLGRGSAFTFALPLIPATDLTTEE